MADKLGPTGIFPFGKLSPDDKGELAVGMRIHENKVFIHFGTVVEWFAVTADQGRHFGTMIAQAALVRLTDSDDRFIVGRENDEVQEGGVFGFMIEGNSGMMKFVFEKPVVWVMLPKKHALGFAKAILHAADHCDDPPTHETRH